jgi:hypothetical protein
MMAFVGHAHESLAQYSVPSQASSAEGEEIALSVRRKAEPPPKKPKLSWEIGSSLNFLTSAPSLAGKRLTFTDVMLLRLHGLVSIGRFKVFAGSDILPKQPSYTDELVWQGALLGARASLTPESAAWIRARGGPQLGRNGYWANAEAAAQYRLALQKELFFESSLGFSHTQLHFKEKSDEFFFVEEVFTQVGLALRDTRRGKFALWLTFDYYLPVVSGPSLSEPDPLYGGLNPEPRVNMHMGGLAAITDNVSLFIEYSILDRGDLEDPTTTLPMLHTGFDQRQLIFGFMRHFEH